MNVDRQAAAAAIEFHYDVGNPFYSLWLDPRMIYSCAMWDGDIAQDDLAGAQVRKLDHHIDQSQSDRAIRMLDVGCGWGGLMQRALERNSALQVAVGLTLSLEQKAYIDTVVLDPRIECRIENWLDHKPDAPYDAITSVGAFEHFSTGDDDRATRVGKYREFFRFCQKNLVKGGKLSLQTIAYGTMRREDANAFIMKEIFPNADLPYLEEIVEAARGVMELKLIRNDGVDYGHTCSIWAQNLKARREEAVAIAGEENVKRYERYLHMSAFGFFNRKIGLLRITAAK